MMVCSDFLLRCITPLKSHVCPMWQYTWEGDATRLERGRGFDLTPEVQRNLLGKLSPDPSSNDFITPPPICAPLCADQAMRTRLLRELPTLDEISITVQ
jgi:hypothetical protein